MTLINDRMVGSGFNERAEAPMTLLVLKETRYYGKLVRVGEEVKVSRSEARRLLSSAKGYFEVRP